MDSEDKCILGGGIALAVMILGICFVGYLETKEKEKTKQIMYSNWNQFSEVEKQQLIEQ